MMLEQQLSTDNFGPLLKRLLDERALSLRKCSTLTGIQTATISRIINGKRKVTSEQLLRFAECLQVPVSDLFEAAGYPVRSEVLTTKDHIQHFLEASDLFQHKLSVEHVKQELSKYEQFSQTAEGKEEILSKFEDKIKKLSSVGPFIDQLTDMFQRFRDKQGPLKEKLLIGSALLYFIATIDLIPDYLLPIGYIDDAIAVSLVVNSLEKSERT